MSSSRDEKISLPTAVIIGVNSMIGAGIFGTISLFGSKIGPAGIISFIIAFFAIWFIAQAFARVAYLYPQEGSFYNYTKQWGGHKLGLAAAGAYLFGLLTAMSLLCKIMCTFFLHEYIPSISPTILGLGTIALLAGLNMAGAVLSQIGQYILIGMTLYPVIAITLLCLTNINTANLTPFMPYGITSVISGIKAAVFGLFGFEGVASLFNIMHHPEKSVPAALRISISIVGFIYFIFISSILLGIPQSTFHMFESFPEVLAYAFPEHPWIVSSIDIAIIFSIMGTIHAVIWACSELLFSYLKVIKIPALSKAITQGRINKKTSVCLASLIMITVFLTVEKMDIFFSLTNVCVLFAFITSIISLLFIKQEWKSGKNYVTLIGLLSACAIFGIALQNLVFTILA
ncbi:APC family permease [Candidatus Babeliales bacterium]|nr:APC family permease [Candidatus Babeliales bacterium]